MEEKKKGNCEFIMTVPFIGGKTTSEEGASTAIAVKSAPAANKAQQGSCSLGGPVAAYPKPVVSRKLTQNSSRHWMKLLHLLERAFEPVEKGGTIATGNGCQTEYAPRTSEGRYWRVEKLHEMVVLCLLLTVNLFRYIYTDNIHIKSFTTR